LNAFVASENFVRVVTTAKASRRAVSAMLEIDDAYTAFCIDEAASFVAMKLKSGATPIKRGNNSETAELLKKGRW